MATFAANLETARDNVAARLVEITSQPKPNYSVDGESYSWAEYFSVLSSQLKTLEEALQRADGPFNIRSRAIT